MNARLGIRNCNSMLRSALARSKDVILHIRVSFSKGNETHLFQVMRYFIGRRPDLRADWIADWIAHTMAGCGWIRAQIRGLSGII